MRSISRARWASLALALSIALPAQLALADRKTDGDAKKKKVERKSVAECTSFDQHDREDEEGVDFSVNNSCSMPVSCSMRWTVTCAPESKKRRSRKSDSQSFALDASNGITLTASTARCGDDGWSVGDISWACSPSQD
jgi:hypothetical protein